ncbi:MAG TPA: MFS transporter [Actinomycetota bacterium]|jgi:MFS family permease|nr:MFS transporter [Actinomycetota bacterium]
MLLVAVAIAVAVAFADSSIVVLALPDLYARFDTTIEGVAWVITSFNLVVAAGALVLVLVVHRARAHRLLAAGSLVFLGASIACALADSLTVLVVARSVKGLGAAFLLAGALPVLGALAGSPARGAAIWTTAGTFGAALGPALGGVLTQAFDWRAIFVAQAPIAGAALLAMVGSHATTTMQNGWGPALRRAVPANLGLALVFGALVGALFLGVLLVIDVFGYAPIEGAAIVSLIPAAALVARPISASLPVVVGVGGGAILLASGLFGLALLPSSDLAYAIPSFALCGFGLGLSVPGLTVAALGGDGEVTRTATFTVGARHLGLVLTLAVVAPILASDLRAAADVAKLNATAVIIDGQIQATTKIPLALDIRNALDRAPRGEIPDFAAVFDEHGARTDPELRLVKGALDESIVKAVTRGFRRSFLFCALLAALALFPVLVFRRRLVP